MPPIQSVTNAWTLLVRSLNALANPYRESALLSQNDDTLAEFVKHNSGILEEKIIAETHQLAQSRYIGAEQTGCPTLLALFWNQPATPNKLVKSSLDKTISALDPNTMLKAFALTRTYRTALGDFAWQNSVNLAVFFAHKTSLANLGTLDLLPECRDILIASVSKQRLPEILPSTIHEMSAIDIEQCLSRYTGLSPSALNESFRGRFIAQEEQLGNVIARDAQTLHSLGVSRQQLASKLEALFHVHWYHTFLDLAPVGDHKEQSTSNPHKERFLALCREQWGEPNTKDQHYELEWVINMVSYMGHALNPFHSTDTYYIDHLGASDFSIYHRDRPDEIVRGPDFIAQFIRRAGFFEGNVSYRVDPTLLCRVLCLVPPTNSQR